MKKRSSHPRKWQAIGANPLAAILVVLAGGIAFPWRAEIYVANAGNDTVETLNASGQSVGSVLFVGGLSHPLALALNNAGDLFVAYSNGSTIEEFTPGGVGSVFANYYLRLKVYHLADGSHANLF